MPIQEELLRSVKRGRRVYWFRIADDKAICGSQLSRRPKGIRCANDGNKVLPNGRCRWHGGTNPGAPITTGKGRSRALLNIKERLESSRDDPSIYDLRGPLAVHAENVARATARLENADTPDFRARARALFRDMVAAQKAGDFDLAGAAIVALGKLLDAGVKEAAAFMALVEASTAQAKRMEGAWKIRLGAAHSVNVRDLTSIMAKWLAIAQEVLPRDMAQRFAQAIERQGLPRLDERAIVAQADAIVVSGNGTSGTDRDNEKGA